MAVSDGRVVLICRGEAVGCEVGYGERCVSDWFNCVIFYSHAYVVHMCVHGMLCYSI